MKSTASIPNAFIILINWKYNQYQHQHLNFKEIKNGYLFQLIFHRTRLLPPSRLPSCCEIQKTRTSCVNNHTYLYNLTRSCENIGRKESRRNRLCSKDEARVSLLIITIVDFSYWGIYLPPLCISIYIRNTVLVVYAVEILRVGPSPSKMEVNKFATGLAIKAKGRLGIVMKKLKVTPTMAMASWKKWKQERFAPKRVIIAGPIWILILETIKEKNSNSKTKKAFI